jgi:hypothetical protein
MTCIVIVRCTKYHINMIDLGLIYEHGTNKEYKDSVIQNFKGQRVYEKQDNKDGLFIMISNPYCFEGSRVVVHNLTL